MSYPWWYIPVITSPMLIAFIATIHVLVSHYAVGGGLLLARENSFAIKTGNKAYRDYWKSHACFFVLLTVVFGAITGVGIWWTIGLVSPLATQTLIRTFVFGWAIEWVFFLIELTAAFAFFYLWDTLPAKQHAIMGWLYGLAAWISLVLITGITGFMLSSKGLFADYAQTGNFWDAFFNIQFLPQTFARTGAALLLGTLYIYAHASWKLENNSSLKALVVSRMNAPAVTGAVLLVTGLIWSLTLYSENSLRVLERAAALNILFALTVASLFLILALIVFIPMRKPEAMTFPFAVCLLLIGFAAFSSAEFIREAVRKPYQVDGFVLANQILVKDVQQCREQGFLNSGIWTKEYLKTENADRGLALYMHHCNDCHEAQRGLSGLKLLTSGEDKTALKHRILHLDNNPSMPPWCGNEDEAAVLARFLYQLNQK